MMQKYTTTTKITLKTQYEKRWMNFIQILFQIITLIFNKFNVPSHYISSLEYESLIFTSIDNVVIHVKGFSQPNNIWITMLYKGTIAKLQGKRKSQTEIWSSKSSVAYADAQLPFIFHSNAFLHNCIQNIFFICVFFE